MDRTKVELVLKYALAIASREDDVWARRLGEIHLLKYVYLADLAFAEATEGKTFSGAHWQFWNFGPWAPEVRDVIQPLLENISAEKFVVSGTKYPDSVRWALVDEELAAELLAEAEEGLPASVRVALRKAVHSFGADTAALLHFVYQTPPMLAAAPKDHLEFEARVTPSVSSSPEAQGELSDRQLKKRREALAKISAAVKERIALKRAHRSTAPLPQPRYDEVFERGVQWLHGQAVDPTARIEGLEGDGTFDDEIWKSPWRGGHDR